MLHRHGSSEEQWELLSHLCSVDDVIVAVIPVSYRCCYIDAAVCV